MADFEKIRYLCKRKGITLKSLAENINMTQAGVQNIFKTNNTSIETLEQLCKYFEVPPSYFLEGLETEFESVKTLKKRIEELEADKQFLQQMLLKQNQPQG